MAFYSDKACVFRVHAKQPKAGDGHTQFGRAMAALNVDTMCANTPQGQGPCRTGQLDASEPLGQRAAACWHLEHRRGQRVHRGLHGGLQQTLEKRKVTRSLTLHYKRVMYILDETDAARRAMGQHVTIYETDDGEVSIRHEGFELPARAFHKEGHVHQGGVIENKHLEAALQYAKRLQQERDDQKLRAPGTTKRDNTLGVPQREAKEGMGIAVLDGE